MWQYFLGFFLIAIFSSHHPADHLSFPFDLKVSNFGKGQFYQLEVITKLLEF